LKIYGHRWKALTFRNDILCEPCQHSQNTTLPFSLGLDILEPYTAAEYTAAVYDSRTFGHNHNHNHISRCSDGSQQNHIREYTEGPWDLGIYTGTETGHWTWDIRVQRQAIGLRDIRVQRQAIGLRDIRVQRQAIGLRDIRVQRQAIGLRDIRVQRPAIGLRDIRVQRQAIGLRDIRVQRQAIGLRDIRVQRQARDWTWTQGYTGTETGHWT
jgi:hypothetical protein